MTLLFEEKGLTQEKYADDSHPLYLYLQGNVQTRSEVILSHPDVIGFVYMNEDIVTKAFLVKKMINFKATSPHKRNIIVAVSGDADDYTPFSVAEADIFSDTLHLTDCTSLNKKTPAISVGKFLKENEDELPDLPKEFDTDAKVKKLKVASFPLILPLIKGFDFEEGKSEDPTVHDSMVNAHDLYSEWIFLHTKKYVLPSSFATDKAECPVPDRACDVITSFEEIPLKVLFKTKFDKTSAFMTIKKEVDMFILENKTTAEKVESIPQVININENKTTCSTNASTSEGSVTNERLTAFLQILFVKPNYDRYGELLSLTPAVLSDDLQEVLTTSSKVTEQARMVSDSMKVLAEDISTERNYLSRAAKFPFLSTTLITYAIQAHYHTESIDVDLESLKKSFSILALLAPPENELDEEYNGYVNSSKNVAVDRMLDQPDEKRATMRKDIFIKGRQENLSDVISFIGNVIIYTRFWVKLPNNDSTEVPLVIQMFTEIADFLSSSAYTTFNDRFKTVAPYMNHTLVCYIFNIFATFVKMAKNPHTVRKLKIDNAVDPKGVRIGQMMFRTLLDQLQLCTATSSLQNLFAHPSFSYKIFFPQAMTNTKKRQLTNKDDENNNNKQVKSYGTIRNNTGKKITFPAGMEKKYCADFLDVNANCVHGKNCKFTHAQYPRDFTENDKALMAKHVQETAGLSFKNHNVS